MSKRIVLFGDYYISEDKISPFMEKWLSTRKSRPKITDFTQRTRMPTPIKFHVREVNGRLVPIRRHIRRIKRVIHRKKMTGIEFENLKRIADRHNVPRDLIDWKSEIDSKLSYTENKTILQQKISQISSNKEFEEMTETQLEAEFETYVNDLKFRASTGDKEAIEQLEDMGFDRI